MKELTNVVVLKVTSGLGVMNIVMNQVWKDVSLTHLVVRIYIGILSITNVYQIHLPYHL